MGLDTSHGAWHGAYSAFMSWREKIAEAAGLPPLRMMQGFCETADPIKWESVKQDPLNFLLYHSDCDGDIPTELCGPIADSLERLLPLLKGEGGGHIGSYREKTETFIKGLRRAAAAGEAIIFH